ncbi:hypothetical protein HDV01_004695 [Terramyces sp. JEL0728]|nr:hypothetical protein HDV01_004695 [Terramyces sp. JEL0728]
MLRISRFVKKANYYSKATEAKLIYGFKDKESKRYQLEVLTTTKRGRDVLKDPILNKGTAFSLSERERLRLRGLLPPRVLTMEAQLQRNFQYLDADRTEEGSKQEWIDLQLYKDLGALADRNETLFYRVLMDEFKKLAPIIYTPTVGQACLKNHTIYRQARGMYFSAADRGHFSSMTYNWTSEVKVIVVTDGSRILGLGDLGSNGMPIPVGKLALYVAAGGLNPNNVLPVVLDVGTNNAELRNNPLYVGLPIPRLEGKDYYSLVDEFLHAVYSRWPRCLVQFEDFKNPHAQEILNKYRNKLCCFNDDIQSTGAIALAGVYASLKARGKEFWDLGKERIVCVGAGSAGIGVCDTIVEAMKKLKLVDTKEEAYERFYLVDNLGLIGRERPHQTVTNLQVPYQRKDLKDGMSLLEVVEKVKPTVLLGLSGCGGIFTKEVIEEMAAHVERPVIFALSNPTKNSECTAYDAFKHSKGNALFASGSPFEDVEIDGIAYHSNQVNNYYIFPGIGLGVTTCLSSTVPDEFFQEAALIIANRVDYDDAGKLCPEVNSIRELSLEIAIRVCEIASEMGIANRYPPKGMAWKEFIQSKMWDPSDYQTAVAV